MNNVYIQKNTEINKPQNISKETNKKHKHVKQVQKRCLKLDSDKVVTVEELLRDKERRGADACVSSFNVQLMFKLCYLCSTNIRMNIYIYIYIHNMYSIYMCTYIYIYIYIHTHCIIAMIDINMYYLLRSGRS